MGYSYNSPDRTDAVNDFKGQESAVLKQNIRCYLAEPRLQRNGDIYHIGTLPHILVSEKL